MVSYSTLLGTFLCTAASLGPAVAGPGVTGANTGGSSSSLAGTGAGPSEEAVTPSHRCGECHKDIYRTWRQSAHSQSLDNPVFLDTYRETSFREGPDVARLCLGCHAPTIATNDDHRLLRKVTWEGVNCDICHSITAVDLSTSPPRMNVELGAIKRGPIRDASSSGHEVAYSELHGESLVCAPCHEYANADGTAILTTYSEWISSAAASAGKHCQHCHMSLTRAYVVDPKIKRSTHAEVNLHEVPGGHSLDQLHEALALGIKPTRVEDELLLEITLANKGAGHAVPTGMPGRRVILDVSVETSAGQTYDERRAYERTLMDAAGRSISRDGGYFAKGVRLKADSRIQADERRKEEFRFNVPTSLIAFVNVKLHYEHAPRGTALDRTWITFLSESRVLLPAKSVASATPDSGFERRHR